jgi:hypothetical protein
MSWNLDLTNDVLPSNTVLPVGKYNAVCDEAIVKSTRDGSGEYISARFNVIDEEFKGRKVFTMFNIKNKNEQAVTIGRQQLKAFMKAACVEDYNLKSVSELEGLRVKLTLKIKTDDYGEKNTISAYSLADLAVSRTDTTVPF